MIINAHLHMSFSTEDRWYFPKRHTWSVAMMWAYGRPPYKDPNMLYPRLQSRWSDPDGTYTIETLDHAGVDAAVILPVDYDVMWGEDSDIPIREKHEKLAELAQRYKGRLIPFVGVDPRRPQAAKILEWGLKDLGFKGLKLIPGTGYPLTDELLFPLFEICIDYGVPVAVCTEYTAAGFRHQRYQEPVRSMDVLAEFPDLKLILLHTGYCNPAWFDQCILGARHGSVYLQIDKWVYGIGGGPSTRGIVPDGVSDEAGWIKMLSRAKLAAGANRIMWGTDGHLGPSEHGPTSTYGFDMKRVVEWWKKLPETAAKYGHEWTAEEVNLVLGTNAARLFGLEETPPDLRINHQYGWRGRGLPPSVTQYSEGNGPSAAPRLHK